MAIFLTLASKARELTDLHLLAAPLFSRGARSEEYLSLQCRDSVMFSTLRFCLLAH